MNLSSSVNQGWQIIHVIGQIDSKTVSLLREYIETELHDGMPVVLDLSAVPFMSSAGLRTLLTLHRRTQDMGVSLALVGIVSDICDTMKVTGFYDYFTIYADLSSLPSG
jgi:anti-sigma B factor antagonist